VKALLHAISKGLLDIVRVIIDHPNYQEEQKKAKSEGTVHAHQKYQYSPDITPLMLAAHMYARYVTLCYGMLRYVTLFRRQYRQTITNSQPFSHSIPSPIRIKLFRVTYFPFNLTLLLEFKK